MAIALRLQNVSRHFGGVTAVKGVSIEVKEGTRHGLIGPNGAGKTTLFNLISGELSTTSGRVELFGQDVTRLAPRRRVALGLGRTYQITRTFASLTVRENLTLAVHGLRSSKYSLFRPWTSFTAEMDEVQQAAQTFDLQDRLDMVASDLSHGELRQLEVALALALKPKLLLFDEPGAGLSPGERVSMGKVIKGLPADLTILMIEHDMDLVRDVVERISVVHFGELVAEGSTAEIQSNAQVREIYLGSTA